MTHLSQQASFPVTFNKEVKQLSEKELRLWSPQFELTSTGTLTLYFFGL